MDSSPQNYFWVCRTFSTIAALKYYVQSPQKPTVSVPSLLWLIMLSNIRLLFSTEFAPSTYRFFLFWHIKSSPKIKFDIFFMSIFLFSHFQSSEMVWEGGKGAISDPPLEPSHYIIYNAQLLDKAQITFPLPYDILTGRGHTAASIKSAWNSVREGTWKQVTLMKWCDHGFAKAPIQAHAHLMFLFLFAYIMFLFLSIVSSYFCF